VDRGLLAQPAPRPSSHGWRIGEPRWFILGRVVQRQGCLSWMDGISQTIKDCCPAKDLQPTIPTMLSHPCSIGASLVLGLNPASIESTRVLLDPELFMSELPDTW